MGIIETGYQVVLPQGVHGQKTQMETLTSEQFEKRFPGASPPLGFSPTIDGYDGMVFGKEWSGLRDPHTGALMGYVQLVNIPPK